PAREGEAGDGPRTGPERAPSPAGARGPALETTAGRRGPGPPRARTARSPRSGATTHRRGHPVGAPPAGHRARRGSPARCAGRPIHRAAPRPWWWPSEAAVRGATHPGRPACPGETTGPPWRTSLVRLILRPQGLISNCLRSAGHYRQSVSSMLYLWLPSWTV